MTDWMWRCDACDITLLDCQCAALVDNCFDTEGAMPV